MRVLIVDDSSDNILVLSRLLTRIGHEIAAARSGEEALRLAAAFRPQVVLLDIWMPQMDGYELAERLRQLEGLKRIRIIALSGATPDPARDEASGIDAHLLKPASLDQMLAAIGPGGTATDLRRQ